jgi:hypothetical protein
MLALEEFLANKGLSAHAGRGQFGWSGRHPLNGIALIGNVTSDD